MKLEKENRETACAGNRDTEQIEQNVRIYIMYKQETAAGDGGR